MKNAVEIIVKKLGQDTLVAAFALHVGMDVLKPIEEGLAGERRLRTELPGEILDFSKLDHSALTSQGLLAQLVLRDGG
ncbi:MAG: hypothetical protein NDJ89_05700 [Oligoflexia bacterium]|nr:hypothetical protein [Oligoflexia bacterium]